MSGELWIVAGPNGAGKSTLVQTRPLSDLLGHVTFWNPDGLALRFLKASGFAGFDDAPPASQQAAFLRAASVVSLLVADHLRNGRSVGVETVLSTDKYKPFVNQVLADGGHFGLITSRFARHKSPPAASHNAWPPAGMQSRRIKLRRVSGALWRTSTGLHPGRLSFGSSIIQATPLTCPPSLIAYGGMGTLEFLLPGAIREVRQALANLTTPRQ